MSLSKKMIAAGTVLAALVLMLFFSNHPVVVEEQSEYDDGETVYLWYTDDSLSDYLSSMAVKFNEERGIRVLPILNSGLEFLEEINDASLRTQTGPDLFIASNDIMEKAYLSGLATEITMADTVVNLDHFPEAALQAVTYRDKILGYPFYFETSALLYNMTYLEEMTEAAIQAEIDLAAAEESQAAAEEGEVEEDAGQADLTPAPEEMSALVKERLPEMIPDNFTELLEFANSYDAPENVEAVFKWDVEDIFYNYFFVGNYINVGGPCGDNTETINIYNENAIRALQTYQSLSDFFAIVADEVDYETVIQEFMDGKLVMTTATTDVIARLEQAGEEGTFSYEYGIAQIPDLSEEMASKSLSVTGTVYVNGYSDQREVANEFAAYLVHDHAGELYQKSGKLSANKSVSYDNPNLYMFMREYEHSAPMPKMMATSNLWVQMEIIFSRIWNGGEVSAQLKSLSEQIMTQVTGEPYEEAYIQPPKIVKDDLEYSTD
ncbi:MAG: extracellular solute-binding protein [Lachnospiraceae bacterium]|nr:extracellular solute-binding protein [Lachnospiraceae bacterium]